MSVQSPPPWSYEVHELSTGFSAIVYDAAGQRVGTDHLTEVDARLIAAAPDMLAALKAVEEWWIREGQHPFTGAPYAIFAAREAITKAQGATP